MKVKRVVEIVKKSKVERESDMTRNLIGDERVSLLEDLRREMSKVTQNEYRKIRLMLAN